MRLALAGLFVLALTLSAVAEEATPIGRWVMVSEKTGEARGELEIKENAGKLTGTIVKLYSRPGAPAVSLCRHCTGADKDKPILGLTLLWGLTRTKDGWGGGSILDPNTGLVYSAKIHVIDGGRKLDVHGYIGLSIIGRSQIWSRASD